MNINPISFGKTIRIAGNNTVKSAYRAAELLNGHSATCAKEAQAQENLWQIFPDATICGPAQVLNLNKGRDVFIVTGKESREATALFKDKMHHINCAYKNYGDDKYLTDLVIDSENDRYEKFAGDLAEETCEGTLSMTYGTKKGQIKEINLSV